MTAEHATEKPPDPPLAAGHDGPPDHGDPARHPKPGSPPPSPGRTGGAHNDAAEGSEALAQQGRDTVNIAIQVLENAVAQREAINAALEKQKAAVRQTVAAQKAAAMLQLIGSLDYLQANTSHTQPGIKTQAPASPEEAATGSAKTEAMPEPEPDDAKGTGPSGPSPEDIMNEVTQILESLVQKEVETRLDSLRIELGLSGQGKTNR